MIHVFCESHGLIFRGMPRCKVHHFGGISMYRMVQEGLDSFGVKNADVAEGDTVIFVFGEGDVRRFIGKQRDKNQGKLEEIIQTLVSSYMRTIQEYRGRFKRLNGAVLSVVPPTDQHYNPQYPFYGTLDDRVKITKCLNAELRSVCAKNSLKFIDLTETLSLEDGSLNPDLSDGTVHAGTMMTKVYQKALLSVLPWDEKINFQITRTLNWLQRQRRRFKG